MSNRTRRTTRHTLRIRRFALCVSALRTRLIANQDAASTVQAFIPSPSALLKLDRLTFLASWSISLFHTCRLRRSSYTSTCHPHGRGQSSRQGFRGWGSRELTRLPEGLPKKIRDRNREKIRAAQKLYREQNKDKLKAYREQNKDKAKAYREQNKHKIKRWYQEHKEEAKAYAARYQQKHKQRVAELKRQWRNNNPSRRYEYGRQWSMKNREIYLQKMAEYRLKYSNLGIVDRYNTAGREKCNSDKQHRMAVRLHIWVMRSVEARQLSWPTHQSILYDTKQSHHCSGCDHGRYIKLWWEKLDENRNPTGELSCHACFTSDWSRALPIGHENMFVNKRPRHRSPEKAPDDNIEDKTETEPSEKPDPPT